VDPRLSLAWATVESADTGRDLQRLRVRVDGCAAACDAVAYPPLCGGPLLPGERVLVNTTAVRLGLGSGGFHVVVAAPDRLPVQDGPGHIVKLRYSPLQLAVRTAGEPGGRGHGALTAAANLAGMPVVAGSLHAQVAPAVTACALTAPALRVAYVMTDGGALPAALLDQVRALRRRGVLAAVITCGHAFGGDLEAAGLAGGLMAARWVAGCDVAVAALGPGVVGTGTPWDTTALELASIVDLTAGLGGRPIAVARMSFADPRARHRSVSHHTRTALALARSPALVPAPDGTLAGILRRTPGVGGGRHAVVEVPCSALLARVRAALPTHTSMGRGWRQEAPLFALAAAAGALAAELALAAGGPSPGPSSAGPAGRSGGRRR
jgi:hypothetical protein